MKRNIWVIATAFVLAGFAVYQHYSEQDEYLTASAYMAAPKTGYQAPPFELKGMDGRTYALNGKRDKPLLVNFWASWCGPCKSEAPDLQKLYAKYGDRIDFYGVNVTQVDKEKDARKFVEDYGIQFPVPMDKDGKVSQAYQVQAFPTTYLIDRNGVIRDAFYLLSPSELERRIKKIIES